MNNTEVHVGGEWPQIDGPKEMQLGSVKHILYLGCDVLGGF